VNQMLARSKLLFSLLNLIKKKTKFNNNMKLFEMSVMHEISMG
jgi:hypothetical protein